MRKLTFLWLLFLICGISVNAQVSIYSYSSLTGTYTEATGGTVHGTTANDDEIFNAVNIGFNFTFDNVSYTQVSISANGFIAMGPTVISSYSAISTGTSNNIISALNGDLESTTTGELSTSVSGTTPNQVFTIQWKNYQHYLGTGDDYNFQIILYETTNVIEIVYGPFTQNATARTAQVGLRGASNADFNNRTTTISWAVTTAGLVNSATCPLTTAIFPADGQIYRYTPPLPCIPPDNGPNTLVFTPTSTSISGSFTPFPGVDAYLVVYSTTTPLTPNPSDLTTYVPGAALGNGTVVGYVTNNTFSVTGLTASTQYYFYIFSTNSLCTGGPLYNVIKPLNGNATTLISDPLTFTATAFSASQINLAATANVQNDSIIIAWNSTNTFGIPTGLYNSGDAVIGGGTVLYKGPVSGIPNHTGLTANTTYYYKAWSLSNNTYSGGLLANATTLCTTFLSFPLVESFETAVPPACWTEVIVADPGTDPDWTWVATGTSPVCTPQQGANMAKFNSYNCANGAESRLASEFLDLSVITNPTLNFWMYQDPGYASSLNEGIYFQVSTDGTTWTTVGSLYQRYNAIAHWQEYTVDLTPYAGQTIHIGFLAHSMYGNNMYLDNINLFDNILPPTCTTLISPADASTNIALNSPISWNSATGATSYDLYLGTATNPPLFINQVGTTYQPAPALLPNTIYYWKVVPRNAVGPATGCVEWTFTTGTSMTFCVSAATSTVDDDLGNVTFAGINNGVGTPALSNSTSVNTYTDFTAISATVTAGATYPISITQINSSANFYACYAKVFIDYNNNGVFDVATESAFGGQTNSAIGGNTVTGNVIIPVTAYIGAVRMRIVLREGGTTTTTLPCGTYTYGETEDYMVNITAPSTPVANFIADNVNPIVNQAVIFTDQSINYPSAWQWTVTPATIVYADATTSTSQNPHIQFTATGLYTVKLKASNVSGADSITKVDYINVTMPTNAPDAYFMADITSGYTGQTISFTDTSDFTPTAWLWTITPATFSFVNATTATSQNPKVQFTTAGVYTVKMVASNVVGADSLTKTDYITILPSYCIANLGGGGTCPGDITVVTIPSTTLNNTTHTNCSTANASTYGSYPATGSNTANLVIGATYTMSVTTSASNIISMWIDYNKNGTFEAIEWTQVCTTSVSGTANTISFTVPVTALAGQTGLRIRSRAAGNLNGAADACTNFGSGIAEDYVINLVLPQLPDADFSADIVNPIINQVVNLTDLSTNYPSSWNWTITPATFTGLIANAQNPSVAFTATGLYTVKLVATNLAGSDSITKIEYINVVMPTNAPDAYFKATPLFTTTGTTVVFQDTSHFTPTAWQWTITPATFTYVNTTTATSQNPQVQFTAAGYYTVKLKAINAAGADSLTKTNYIHIITAPCTSTATSTADDDIGNVTFAGINNGIATPSTSNPTSNNLYTNFTNLPPAQVAQGATFPISISTIYSAGFYTGAIKVYIDYDQNGTFDLPAELVFSGSAVTAGTPVTGTISIPATADTGLTIMRIVLDESDVANPCGTYTWGETEDYIVHVAPQVAPDADFVADILNPIVQQTVSFTDLTLNFPTSWQWTITPATFTFVNATTAASQNPQVKFTAAGLYTVKLKATNNTGSDSITKVDYINVTVPTNAPIAGFTVSPALIYQNSNVNLVDTSLYTPTAWSWIISPNTFAYFSGTDSTSQNAVVQFALPGDYTIQLIATNAAGVDTSILVTVHVYPSYCNSNATSTVDDDLGNVTFAGINNGIATPALNNATATNTYTDFTSVSPAQVAIGATYPISISQINSGSYYGCGVKVYIDYDQNGNWDLPAELAFSGNTVTAGIAVTGNITISSTTFSGFTRMRVVLDEGDVADPCGTYTWGETEDYTIQILPPPIPVAGFTVDNNNPVLNQGVQFSDTSLNFPTSWLWSFDPNTVTFLNGTSATSQNPVVAFSDTGYYAVQLIAANMTGSDTVLTDTLYIHVTIPTTPPIAYFYADDTTVTTIQTVSLIDTSLQIPTAWSWSITPNTFIYVNGTSATSQNPQVLFNAAGIYSVQLIAGNYAGTDTAIRTDYITVIEQYNMSDSILYTCDAMFYDYGGPTGVYLNSMNDTLVVYPNTPGAKLSIIFSSFNLESATYDYLKIFDGNTSNEPLLGTYGGTVIPPVTTSTAADGSLTFVFRSDGSVTYAGWEAQFSCVMPPIPVAGFYADNLTPIVDQVINIVDTSLNFPTSWTWSITPTTYTYANGTDASTQNPQVSFQISGLYTVTLIATNASGSDTAIHTDYINVTIPTTPPIAYFYADDTTATTAQIVSLIDTSAQIPTAWAWTIVPATFNYMNGTTASSQNPQVQFTAQGLYTVTLDATNAAGTGSLTKTDYIVVVGSTNMSNDTIVTCSSVLYDSGGQNGNYADNETTTLSIQPATPGNVIQIDFSLFDVQPGWDNLNVYNGTGTTGTLLGTFTGTTLPPSIISTAADGALTLQFTSNANTTTTGWDAYVSCIVPPAKSMAWSDTVFTEAVANNGTIATVATLTLTNETFADTGTFTDGVEYTASNVPVGLAINVVSTGVSSVTVSLTGTAVSHTVADNINNLTINFLDAAFSGNSASSVTESSKSNLEVHYYDPLIVPDVVFTEIMYRSPASGTDSLEYMELYNNGITSVDLSNYTFAGVAYTIPNGTILNAGEYLVVAKNAAAMLYTFGVTALQWNAGVTNNLSNTGELIKLVTFWGATVDSLVYSSIAPWPTQAAGNGTSLTLCDPTSNNALSTSWAASASVTTHIINAKVLTGSPGAADDACAPVDLSVTAPTSDYDYCNGSTADTIKATIQNVGSTSVGSGQVLHVSYQIDGGTVVTENHTLTTALTPGSQVIHSFVQLADMSAVGPHDYIVYVKYVLDNIAGNDTSIGIANHLAVVASIVGGDTILIPSFPYTLNVTGSFDSYLWSNNDGSQTGTNATFSADTAGWYYVTITNLNGCTDNDSVYVDFVTGTQLVSQNMKVSVYPNPAKGNVNVEVTMATSDISVELFSAEGRLLYKNEKNGVNTYKGNIDLRNYAPGVYTLLINTGKDVYRKKLIIQ